MTQKKTSKEKRKADPYMDRRSGEERREIYDIDYFANGGTERREAGDRRKTKERRKGYVKVSKWSSVRTKNNSKKSND